MKFLQKFVILAVTALTFWPATAVGETNFTTCLAKVKNGTYGTGQDIGGTDNQGRPVNTSVATGVTYHLCLDACGGAQEPFDWIVFSQQFSSWLLPWLALLSQLPFGANDKLDNLESVLLTLGSPALAAYSLALTVLNERWIAQRFAGYTYPNVQKAIRIFRSLQQSPLKVEKGVLLASLVVLPDNDGWWSELEERINDCHTWSISAVANIAWVVIAYVFTLIDSFTGDITDYINTNGLGVGSLWLWLLPIVIGWLRISPRCDSTRLSNAIQRANSMAYVATDQGSPILVTHAKTGTQAVELTLIKKDVSVRRDEKCTVPIYNYARFLPWVETVEEVSAAFEAASNHCHESERVDGSLWVKVGQGEKIHDSNRVGNATQVKVYCHNSRRRSCLGPKVLSRIFVASVCALMLQWGTAGAAILVVWYTPTRGLGCRSASYLLYAVLSTVVWMLLVTSSVLTHYHTTMTHNDPSRKVEWPTKAAKRLSITFRRLSKAIAAFNATWILVSCGFQFSNFFNRCYCNSSVFRLRDRAYAVISFPDDDVGIIKDTWIGGAFLAAGCAVIYVLFIYIYINRPLDRFHS